MTYCLLDIDTGSDGWEDDARYSIQQNLQSDARGERTPRYPKLGAAVRNLISQGRTAEAADALNNVLPVVRRQTINVRGLAHCTSCRNLHVATTSVNGEGESCFCQNCVLRGRVVHSRLHRYWINREHAWAVYDTRDDFERRIPSDFVSRFVDVRLWDPDGRYVYTDGRYMLATIFNEIRRAQQAAVPTPLNSVGGYHSSRDFVGHIPSPQYDNEYPRLLMGLEMEVECPNGDTAAMAKWVRDTFNTDDMTYCGTERDGSLSNGFEVVTGYTGLDVHEKMLQRWAGKPAGIQIHGTCGVHVHLDRANLSPLHELRLVKFMHDPKNTTLMKAVARRDWTHFCKRADKTGAKKLLAARLRRLAHDGCDKRARYTTTAAQSYAFDRYEAVNMTNAHTIEFRLFRGSTNVKEIMAALEFSRMVWLFTRDTPEAELTTTRFIDFIDRQSFRRETRYLRNALVGMGAKASPAELLYLLSDFARVRIRDAA